MYNSDKEKFDDFTNNKSKAMDFAVLKRLILSELSLNRSFQSERIFGFSKKQILNMCKYPEQYGKQILRLVDYMYQKSGYMRRLVDYFSNMPKLNFYVDTEVTNASFFKINEDTFLKKIPFPDLAIPL